VKSILMSVMVLTLLGGLVGGGLFAHFTDTEESLGNTFTAGTLDLEPNMSVAENFDKIKPCCWFKWEEHQLTNVGTLNGTLTVHLSIADEGEGDNPEPEVEAEAANGQAGLAELLDVIVVYCYPENVLHLVETAETWQEAVAMLNAANITDQIKAAGKLSDVACTDIVLDGDMAPGEGSLFQVLVHLEQDNRAQGDFAVVDKLFKLEQLPCE
jgi:predicted ribosomally synthesized peptide with SipW-like signal peptide